jgi:hypothetical protein
VQAGVLADSIGAGGLSRWVKKKQSHCGHPCQGSLGLEPSHFWTSQLHLHLSQSFPIYMMLKPRSSYGVTYAAGRLSTRLL